MSARTADAVTLGDSWLGPAIKADYLQPLQDVDSYRWWVSLQSYLALAQALALSLALALACPTCSNCVCSHHSPAIKQRQYTLQECSKDSTVERPGLPCTASAPHEP